MELAENRCEFLFGNADPGVPDLETQLVAAPPAAEQDLALIRVFHRVREQVADHLLEQAGIAAHAEAARADAPGEAMRCCVKAGLRSQMLEHCLRQEIHPLSADETRLHLFYVHDPFHPSPPRSPSLLP